MDIISFNEAATANGRIEKFIENPDSNSGIITVPKTIEAGESITVPAGRIAILPNVEVNGTLNVEGDGEIFIPAGATLSKVVELTGEQTISGVKTFSSSPIVPTPTTDFQVATKKYVDDINSNELTSRIGLIDYGYVGQPYHIVAFGGEFNRADYPKLWAYLQANPSLVKTQAQWQTESTTNGGICGFYSSGNETTTFRVPNLDKAFLRPDSRGVASYQADEFKSHYHSTRGQYGASSGAQLVVVYSEINTTGASNTTNTGGAETRPKNIAILPLIVAK